MRPFQFQLKEHWRSPRSLDILLPWSETISAHLEWWQNPANVMKGADLHPKTTVSKSLDTSNEGWGSDFEQISTRVCGQTGKKRLHKCRVEGVFSDSSRFNDQCQNQTV